MGIDDEEDDDDSNDGDAESDSDGDAAADVPGTVLSTSQIYSLFCIFRWCI